MCGESDKSCNSRLKVNKRYENTMVKCLLDWVSLVMKSPKQKVKNLI